MGILAGNGKAVMHLGIAHLVFAFVKLAGAILLLTAWNPANVCGADLYLSWYPYIIILLSVFWILRGLQLYAIGKKMTVAYQRAYDTAIATHHANAYQPPIAQATVVQPPVAQ